MMTQPGCDHKGADDKGRCTQEGRLCPFLTNPQVADLSTQKEGLEKSMWHSGVRLLKGNDSSGGLDAMSCLTLATPWTVACQPALSTGFSRQGYCSGLPFPSPEDLPTQGLNLDLLHCRWILYRLSHRGSPITGLITPKLPPKFQI